MDKRLIGKRIKECRKEAKLSQEELGSRLGIKKSAVSKWETGKVTNIKGDTVSELAKLFNVSPMWILGYDVPKVAGIRSVNPFANLEQSLKLLVEKYETFAQIPPEKLDALSVVAQEAALLKLHQLFLLK